MEALAEWAASHIGSATYVIGSVSFCLAWIGLNWMALFRLEHFDPYPFILLNLALSFQAMLTGPMILMAQNLSKRREQARDAEVLTQQTKTDKHILDALEAIQFLLTENLK